MKKTHKKTNKIFAAVIIATMVFAAVSLLHFANAFQYLEFKSYDLRVKSFAPLTRPSDEIIILFVDQSSISWAQEERGWGWPWPRKAYAEVLEYMNIAGAASVAFDIIFSEPSIYRNSRQDEIIDSITTNLETAQGAIARGQAAGTHFREVARSLRELSSREDDASFAAASQDYGRAVQTVFFSSQTGSALSWPPDLEKPLFEPEGFGGFFEKFVPREGAGGMSAQFPIERLSSTAGALGCITGEHDPDDVIRRMRLFTVFGDKAVPGLGPASLLVSGHDANIVFNPKKSSIQWGNFTIPVDKNGASLLRFRGSLDRYIPYSAKEILQSYEEYQRGEEPLLHPDFFTGTHVFFGLYAPGLFDIFSTPISSMYPGMGAHITMLDNILSGDFIRESRQWFNLLVLFAVVGCTVLLCLFSDRILLPIGGTVLAVAAVVAAAFAAYYRLCLWLPMVTHLAGIAAAFISATLYNYATEGSQKRFIKSAFSQYLSPKVIDQIIADPSQLKLGGEKREMTAIFTDVRSFSTITEVLGDPKKLVELLNHYLTRMSDIILANQGTIDKYEGDAIIAFFGAPVHFDNHAVLACRSAIQMKKAEAEFNRESIASGLITEELLDIMARKGILRDRSDPVPMFTRIGINTGDIVVGNMGTPKKMNYTMMGNAVNLAARLEGVNKQYNTGGILISEHTRAQIGDEFALRPLSRVRVVGINTPLRLYELLAIKRDAAPSVLEMVQSWKRGMALYEQKDFSAASAVFHTICQQNGDDLAAKKYYNRCCRYSAQTPDEESWDGGVDNLTEK
ncbi:MAG: adenylate/guanylate cyclase domain-containing protein [Treponema sp.]|nr:adenylate/guanylate cyclase domain-containing protein [Treponema sp.]